jgi:REP element-mobilizing transposase RayT
MNKSTDLRRRTCVFFILFGSSHDRCSKYRHQVIKDAIETELKKNLSETCIAYDWQLQSLEIMPNHVPINDSVRFF